METTYVLSMVTALKHLNGILIARCNDGVILLKYGGLNVCKNYASALCCQGFTHKLVKSPCVHIIYSILWHFLEMYHSFVPRRSLCSSCVWRLRQTSSAFYSSPSNGCFSPPAPTYGSSTSGTQVSSTSRVCQQPSLPQSISAQNLNCQVSEVLIISFAVLVCRKRSLSAYSVPVDPVCVH